MSARDARLDLGPLLARNFHYLTQQEAREIAEAVGFAGWVSPEDVARIKAEAKREALREAADALESASVARRDKELSAGSPVEDMREDRLIRLGIAEATVTIRTITKTVEAQP